MGKLTKISVVCPVYACSDCLMLLCDRLKTTLSQLTEEFEIILINDACPQNSWEIIESICALDQRVKGINLSRNFGQHYAITAGLEHAAGQWIVVMDADLQDQPEEIIKLYQKAQEGYDIVVGERTERCDSFFKKLTSRCFYAALAFFTDLEHDAAIANFGIYSRNVVQSILLFREQNRAFPLLVNMVGFKKISIPIIHAEREMGVSSYTFKKLFKLAMDSIVVHSNKPLRLSIKLGVLVSFFSVSYALWLVVRHVFYAVPVPGWTSMMVVMLFMFGLLFSVLGVLGVYVGKVFDQAKGRPLYLAQQKINFFEG